MIDRAREAFEHYVRDRDPDNYAYTLGKDHHGDYKLVQIQAFWVGFQAGFNAREEGLLRETKI